MNSFALLRPLLAVVIFLTAAATAFAQGSAFTYQGKLTDGGSAPTGAYDFRFILYNADAGGSQVGTTLTADDVAVTAGAFTVVLDFGPNIFDGQARWLELAVRQGASTGVYTVLSPRQPVTPAPYAIFAAKAGSVANGGITAAQLAPGAVTGAAIASGAITADKIPDGAISTNKLSPSVLAGLGGVPSGAVLMSQDPNATNLTAAGYVRFGFELTANENETIYPTGPFLPRNGATTAWTGGDWLIWGGTDSGGNPLPTPGARYNLSSNSFVTINSANGPTPRHDPTAIWTGDEMIIWGGHILSTEYFTVGTGGRYHLVSDSWTPTSALNAPYARSGHSAVWTGTEMIIWGGFSYSNLGGTFGGSTNLSTGARYNPASNTWTPLSTNGAPTARCYHFAVWTGSQMLVWGGATAQGGTATGGLYNPITDSWTPMNTANAPTAGSEARSAVWTGSELVFLSSEPSARSYTPATDTWRTLPIPPIGAHYSLKVWTGSALVVFGVVNDGFGTGSGQHTAAAQTFNWALQRWTLRVSEKPPDFRFHEGSKAVWLGDSALILDARSTIPLLRYRPQGPLYLYLKP